MLDLIMAVDDTREWHKQNMQENARDYSGVRWLGAGAVDLLQQMGAGAYFNPFVQINGRVSNSAVVVTHQGTGRLLISYVSMSVECQVWRDQSRPSPPRRGPRLRRRRALRSLLPADPAVPGRPTISDGREPVEPFRRERYNL